MLDLPELPERAFIATGLRRPMLEYIRDGAEVFIVATVEGHGFSLLSGDASIGVMIGRLGSMRVATHAPLNSITAVSGYVSADELQDARRRLNILEPRLAAITAAVDETPCLDWKATVERIREIVHPAPEPEDDD